MPRDVDIATTDNRAHLPVGQTDPALYIDRMHENALSQIIAPRPGGHMFVFKEAVPPEGGAARTIAFTDVDIQPRGYEELAGARLHEGITIPLEMHNGRIVETDVEDMPTDRYAHFTTTLQSPFTAKAIGLVRGGWLPSALAATKDNAVVMPDRNIISEIAGRFANGQTVGRPRDFLDLFADTPVKINPMLFALEGNGREIPDPATARAQLHEAVAKLRAALPAATLMFGPQSFEGLLGLIEDSRPGMARKQALLRRLAPALAAPVARRNVDARWAETLASADELGVPRNAPLMLALLSTIVNPGGRCAARRLLKFHPGYSDADAYNALSDLRTLDILLFSLALVPDHETQICTGDRDLALFWVGMGASEIRMEGNSAEYSMWPHEAILPEAYAKRFAEDVRKAG